MERQPIKERFLVSLNVICSILGAIGPFEKNSMHRNVFRKLGSFCYQKTICPFNLLKIFG